MAETADDFLEHFGVKGMKWGRHKGPNPTSKPKLTSADIHAARARQAVRVEKHDEAFAKSVLATSDKGRKAADRQMAKMEKEIFTHPDAAVASKMTKGEKATAAVATAAWGVAVALIVKSALR